MSAARQPPPLGPPGDGDATREERQGIRSWTRWVRTVIRLTPFDTTTSEGRSLERYRRAGLTAAASAGTRAVGIGVVLITVPLTLHYLGAERYGLWLTISALMGILSFADFGIGNGLLNAVSDAHGKDDTELAAVYVSSAMLALCATAAALGGLLVLVYPHIPWPRLFNVSSERAVAEAGPAVAVFLACFIINLPLTVAQRVRLAYQQGFVNSVFLAAGQLLALAGILLAIKLRLSVPWIVLASSGAPVLALLANGLVLFYVQRTHLRPRLGNSNAVAAREILASGFFFFLLQAAAAFAFWVDNLVVAHTLGPESVPQYAIPKRIFDLIPAVLSFALAPLWPAYREATSRGEPDWTRRVFVRSVKASAAITAAPAVLLFAFGRPLVHLWVGPSIHADLLLLLALAFGTVMSGTGNAIAMFLNGLGAIRFQAATAILMAAVGLALKIVLARELNVAGVALGMVLAYGCLTLLPISLQARRLLRSISTRG